METLSAIFGIIACLCLVVYIFNAVTHKHFAAAFERKKEQRRTMRKYYRDFSIEDTKDWEGDAHFGPWVVSDAVRFLVEVAEDGEVTREIGLDEDGVIAHHYSFFELKFPHSSFGLSAFDHSGLPKEKLRNTIPQAQFEEYWDKAKKANVS